MSTTNTTDTVTKTKPTHSEENRWVSRLEELLKVKNVEDLKSELVKLASDIQKEIQSFDLNAHLSPEAKTRLKGLESRYNEVIRAIQKVQKQFDKEIAKSVKVLKRTRDDAETQIKKIKARITKHRSTIVKASTTLTKKIKATAKNAKKSALVKRVTKRTKAKAKTANA
jgi:hypothetical protein